MFASSRLIAVCTPNCKSLWIKASAKWLNVNVNVQCRKGGTPMSDAAWAFPVEWIRLTNALKSVRAFLAFTSFKSHAWRGSPCWHRGPSLTPRASQQKTCLFHPVAGESHPSRLRAAISSQVTASASRPPNFTFPSLPVRQCVLISHRTPARASWAEQTLPFPPHGRRDLPIQTASIFLPSDVGESLPATHLTFYVFTCPTQRVLISRWRPARCSRPDNLTTLSLPVQRSESWSPVGRRRGAPGQTILLSSVFTCPTRRVLISRWTPARCSRPDNLTFSVFTCPTQKVLISRWTPARCSRPDNLTFPVFTCPTQRVLISRWTPARCSRPDNLTFSVFTCPTQWVSMSRWTPARCSRPVKRSSVCSHQKYRTPSNAIYPAVLAILAFSPPPARLDHQAHEYQSHVRCRKSLPVGQPHLFFVRQRS